jgi:hypothetical protein
MIEDNSNKIKLILGKKEYYVDEHKEIGDKNYQSKKLYNMTDVKHWI